MSTRSALVVEDKPDTRAWLAQIVRRAFPGIVVHGCADLRSARRQLEQTPQLRLALVDIGLPDGSGIDLIREMRMSHQETSVIVMTVYSDDESLFAALAAGAQGYLLKSQSAELLVRHLQLLDEGVLPLAPGIARRMLQYFQERPVRAPTTADAGVALSPRETEVLTCIGCGLRVSETAERLGLAESTVASYVKSLYAKLNISTRAEAALEAVRRGLT